MIEKLEMLKEKYEDFGRQLGDPEVIANPPLMQRIAKAHSDLEEVVAEYHHYQKVKDDMATALEMLNEASDPDEQAMLKEELKALENEEPQVLERLRVLLLPKDPNDEKNIIMEIRAGTGGEEAALFAGDLFRMYM
ncbi:MAG TPA: PCRF domain-containing protein, partial [Bacillota bacterium]|nr:PCRF domain-containing protein [Bacillota bacterium]